MAESTEAFRFGRYEVSRAPAGGLEELGRGAMGVTYLARDTLLQRVVVLKVVSPERLSDETGTARKRFLREAAAAAQIVHPHIAAVHDIGQQDGRDFYVMEFVVGESLEETVHRIGPLPWKSCLLIARHVALGLGAAWKHHLIHRDIKPSNLMLTTPPETAESDGGLWVKLIDFGLVKNVEEAVVGTVVSLSGGFLGTPAFASPEQLEGRPMDVRSDFYSLGITLFFALTGELPFAGSSFGQIVTGHLVKPPPLQKLRERGVPEPFVRVVEILLAKDSDDRPVDPDALIHLLEEAERKIAAGPESSPSPVGAKGPPVFPAAPPLSPRAPGLVALPAATAPGESDETIRFTPAPLDLADSSALTTAVPPHSSVSSVMGTSAMAPREAQPETVVPDETAPRKPVPAPKSRAMPVLQPATVVPDTVVPPEPSRRAPRSRPGPRRSIALAPIVGVVALAGGLVVLAFWNSRAKDGEDVPIPTPRPRLTTAPTRVPEPTAQPTLTFPPTPVPSRKPDLLTTGPTPVPTVRPDAFSGASDAPAGDPVAQALTLMRSDPDAAMRVLREAAATRDDAKAMSLLGSTYYYGIMSAPDRAGPRLPSGKNYFEAAKWLALAADRGDDRAQVMLAQMHKFGFGGLDRDNARAVSLAEGAAARGNAVALTYMGLIYAEGPPFVKAKDPKRAVASLQQSAAAGFTGAQSLLGFWSLTGFNVRTDVRKGISLLRDAETAESVTALYFLGLAHLRGLGVERSEEKAIQYFRSAAQAGNEASEQELRKRGLTW